jgi:tetratricopeptide (TPR) repeat protein
MQLLASARFLLEEGWQKLKVEPLELGDAVRLVTQIWSAAGKSFPPKDYGEINRLLAYCGQSTVHFKRALLLAVELDLPLATFFQDHTTEGMVGQDALETISRRMVQKELELLGQQEQRHGFAYRSFLELCYSLLLRVGHFTCEELEAWFGSHFRVGTGKAIRPTYYNGLLYLVRLGFLGLRREKNTSVYYMPPNQRLVLKGLTNATLLPPAVPLRAPKARLTATLEGAKAGSPAALQELLNLQYDYRELATEPQAAAAVVVSMMVRAELLGTVAPEEAISIYDEIAGSFGTVSDSEVIEQVAKALVNKAVTLGQAGQTQEELAAYDEVVQRYADRPEPSIVEQVAMALVNKAVTLGQAGQTQEELAAYDEVVRRYADRPEPGIAEQVAKALVNKAVTLGQAGQTQEELAACDEVVQRYADRPEPGIAERVAKALVNKAVTLGQAGQTLEAVAACDEVVRRYADRPEPGIAEQVAKTYSIKNLFLNVTEGQ